MMNQNIERRAAANPGRGRRKFVPNLWHGVSAAGLMVVGFAWASQRPLDLTRPGARIELPAALVTTPAPATHFAYLSRALGEDEARRLEPTTFRVAQVLKRYARDDYVAERAAAAVVVEGEKHKLDPSLLVGLMIIENAKIEPTARSNVGATGLMQVMPFHAGEWGCGSTDLVNIESNICHGVNILAKYMKTSPNLDRALLRYNGCVRGTNTPNCHTYPTKVKRWQQHARTMMDVVGKGDDIKTVALIPRTNAVAKKAPAAKRTVAKAPAKKAPAAKRTVAKAPAKKAPAKSTRRVAAR
jgi:hypothetical protein